MPLESFVILQKKSLHFGNLDGQNELSVWQIKSPYLMSLGVTRVWDKPASKKNI
jgi:hypothetical protein